MERLPRLLNDFPVAVIYCWPEGAVHEVAASEPSPLFIVARGHFGNVSVVYLWVMGRAYWILCVMTDGTWR